MKFAIASATLLAALSMAACSPPATTLTTSTTVTTSTTAPASFTIGVLAEHDADIQGCTASFSRQGDTSGQVFAENGVDTGAFGFIRINGNLIPVDLVTADENEKGATRTFADKGHTLSIVETTVTGAAHPEADSVESSGTLAVTFGGSTQTLQIEGGTAC